MDIPQFMFYSWSMKELKELEAKLVKQLENISETLRIYSEQTQNPENVRPVALDSEEVNEVLLSIKGNFLAQNAYTEVQKAFPNASLNQVKGLVNSGLNYLVRETKQLRFFRERSGRTPAIYINNQSKN